MSSSNIYFHLSFLLLILFRLIDASSIYDFPYHSSYLIAVDTIDFFFKFINLCSPFIEFFFCRLLITGLLLMFFLIGSFRRLFLPSFCWFGFPLRRTWYILSINFLCSVVILIFIVFNSNINIAGRLISILFLINLFDRYYLYYTSTVKSWSLPLFSSLIFSLFLFFPIYSSIEWPFVHFSCFRLSVSIKFVSNLLNS